MKMTKRIAAMAACAVMAATSMVGICTSAADVSTNDNFIGSVVEQNNNEIVPYADGDVFNGMTKGAYYSPDSSAFVLISGTSSSDAKCTFSRVYVGMDETGETINQYISGVPHSWAAGTTGGGSISNRAFIAEFSAGSWFYTDSSGKNVRGNYAIKVRGTYSGKTISIYGIDYTR